MYVFIGDCFVFHLTGISLLKHATGDGMSSVFHYLY